MTMFKKIQILLILLMSAGCTFKNPLTVSKAKQEKQPSKLTEKEFLALLSSEERFVLEHFFRCLIQEDSFGYVLLGGKPMSFYSYLKPKVVVKSYQADPVQQMDLLFEGFNEKDALFHEGWEVWKKYQHYFCGKNIFFDAFEQERDLHFMKVIMINKKIILSLLNRFSQEFSLLGTPFSQIPRPFAYSKNTQRIIKK